jgi:hypothetical protein
MNFDITAPIVEIRGYPTVVYLTHDDKEGLKAHLSCIAGYFKKEMHYTHLQYAESMYEDSSVTGFVILQRAMDLVRDEDHFPSRVIGGGTFFDKSGVEKADSKYVLDWIWLHPFARNRKLLRDLWPSFKKRFGSFELTTPLSLPMQHFVEREKLAKRPRPQSDA